MKKFSNDISPNIVVIGGGTGNSVILRGLKEKTPNIATVVAMGDNGGSTGVLREDLGMLPPGDIRACLLALSNTESSMEDVFKYRFEKGKLKGQSLGNLVLAALNEIYGSFEKAVAESSNILNITGKVFPMTTEDVNLKAIYSDGSEEFGESEIPEKAVLRNTTIDHIELVPNNPKPMEGTLEKISEADIIILGPGSLYTSVVPNLLVSGIVDAINASSAIKIYICNIMTQDGETTKYGVKEHVQALLKHAPDLKLDKVIANNGYPKNPDILEKYSRKNQDPIIINDSDYEYFNNLGIDLIEEPIMDAEIYVKHNSEKISDMIIDIFLKDSDTKEFSL